MKYKDPQDSAGVVLNFVDEHYLPVHRYKLIAGKNFSTHPVNGEETEVIVNEQLIKRFKIGKGDPQKAIGEVIATDGKKLTISGVVKDFHYGTVIDKIEPAMFRYSAEPGGYINVWLLTLLQWQQYMKHGAKLINFILWMQNSMISRLKKRIANFQLCSK
jgi:hypothetical protein